MIIREEGRAINYVIKLFFSKFYQLKPNFKEKVIILHFTERSPMTSSKIQGFQTPSPSVIVAIPPDDVIFWYVSHINGSE